MKQWFKLCALSTAALIVGCGGEPDYIDFGLPKVKVVDLSNSEERLDKLYFPAIANAAERSHLSFRVAGEINNIYVKEGQRLTKGTLIAEIDPTDYRLQVDNAAARFSVVDSQFKRSKPLVDKGLLAKSQFDEIDANRQIALAELELSKLRLSFTKLYAPVDGIISRVSVDQFENIQVGQQVVNIHSIENVEVLIQLPDRLYTSQPSHQEMEDLETFVKVPSGNVYPATVKEYTTEPDPATGTFTVTLSLPMPEQEFILDGMAVEVTAKGGQADINFTQGVQVPVGALFNDDGASIERENKFVWLVNPDNTVTKRKVVTGNVSQNVVQILDGLKPDQKIVIAGISPLREGMKVQIVNQEADNE